MNTTENVIPPEPMHLNSSWETFQDQLNFYKKEVEMLKKDNDKLYDLIEQMKEKANSNEIH